MVKNAHLGMSKTSKKILASLKSIFQAFQLIEQPFLDNTKVAQLIRIEQKAKWADYYGKSLCKPIMQQISQSFAAVTFKLHDLFHYCPLNTLTPPP